MRRFFRLIFYSIVLLIIFFAHVSVRYILPTPWNSLNTVFLFLIFFLWSKEKGSVVWISFFFHFLLEFISDLPFGITTLSGTVSTVIGYWLYTTVFTNRSWYATSLLLVAVLLFFRILFSFLLWIHTFLFDSHFLFGTLVRFSLWEMAVTGGIFFIASALLSHLTLSFRPERVR